MKAPRKATYPESVQPLGTNKNPSGRRAPEKTKLLFEMVFLLIGFGLGACLLLLLAIGRPSGSGSESLSKIQYDLTHLLGIGGMALLSGLAGWGLRKHRHRLKDMKEDLLRNGERRAADVVEVVQDHSTMVNGLHPWRVHARCEIDGRLCEFRSWEVWEDPSPHLASRTIDVYVMLKDPARYFVDTRFLESGVGEVKEKPPARSATSRRSEGHRKDVPAEVDLLPPSDGFRLFRHFTVPRVLFTISLPLLVGGVVWLKNEIDFFLNGHLVEGRLEKVIASRKPGSTNRWYIISYQDPRGETDYFTSRYEPSKWVDPEKTSLIRRIFPESLENRDRVVLRADWWKGKVRVEKWIYWFPPVFLLIPGLALFTLAWYTRGGRWVEASREESE